MAANQSDDERLDIVEELERRGDDLSMRAARYIRIKRTMLEQREITYRNLCGSLLSERERHQEERAIATEQYWKDKQGEDYGSY